MKEVYRRRWIVSLNQNSNETAVSVAREVKDGKKRDVRFHGDIRKTGRSIVKCIVTGLGFSLRKQYICE